MCVCVCVCVYTHTVLVLGMFHLKVSFPYTCAIIIIFFDMCFEQREC